MTCDFYVVGYSFSQVLREAKLLVDAEGDVGDLPSAWLCGFKEAGNYLNFLYGERVLRL
ncbi:hypothetical protein HAQ01_08820 [Acidithiobacillus thiooxidans]|uniref:Uncharacterized protein n=1 Tax=Acidithiobacillus thiooxidans ATCC 19377 TaxID=637390 RepID=A0A5P9XLG3_ACITH|nr:hypothetical protein [Acidithiobacillus thiooxidans]MBU2793489.1 hypothetical protein [Acidithiobacillus thiooxidans]QFX94807.1 hypothetical protein GCD22_00273 [Acidithiobacillus thiooxidans ATCC 19377]